MAKDILLFNATYSYLSIPQYESITPYLTKYHKILINSKDPFSASFDNNYITDDIVSNYFDEYHELAEFPFNKKGVRGKIHYCKHVQKEIQSYLNKIRPKAVVSCSDMTLTDRIISSWCSKKKIPFIILQAAILAAEHSFGKQSLGRYGLKYKIKRIFLNNILKIPLFGKQHLFGEEDERTFLILWSEFFALNLKRKNMFFVGNPAYDKRFQQFNSDYSQKPKNNIVICTQDIKRYYGEEKVVQLNNIYKSAIKARPNLHFYIKVHPRESIEKYENTFPKSDFPNTTIVREYNLYSLFKICRLQISFASATAIEAVVVGVPIIITNPNNSLVFIDYFREEIDLRVTNTEEMIQSIDKALSEEYYKAFLVKREAYLKKILYSTDGMSGERASTIIEKLA